MKLQFKLDGKLIKGTAEEIDKVNQVLYLVDLELAGGKRFRFTICMNEDGNWETDDIANPDMVTAAGSEIMRYDEGYDEHDLPPNNYQSRYASDLINPIFKDGEIVNEPEDVDEQAIH